MKFIDNCVYLLIEDLPAHALIFLAGEEYGDGYTSHIDVYGLRQV